MSLFKHIPCPKGDDCAASLCPFNHPKEKYEPPSQGLSSDDTSNETTAANQDVPRKRVRTDPFHPPPSPKTPQDVAPSSSGTSRGGSTDDIPKPVAKKLETAARTVSPPPLKRKMDTQDHTPKASSKIAKTSHSATESRPSSARKPVPVKPKKAETLNPRLLKRLPAAHDVRLRLVKMLHQELTRLNKELKAKIKKDETRLLLSDQDLIVRTLDEEEYVAVHKTAVYSNVMKNKVMQYKRMKVDQWKAEREDEIKRKELEAAGKDPNEKPTEIKTGLTPAQEVELTKRILTPIDKLSNHGYVASIPSEADIEKARQGIATAAGWEKCDRCQQRFQVFPGRREEDGALTSGGTCTFHWGKTFIAPKAPGDNTRQPKRYQCCGQEVGDSVGCFTRDHHVFKTSDPKRLASVLNFAETPENPVVPTDRAVAFDCEMGYTVFGMELIRLTATSWPTGEELLDVLVRPLGEILDLNSRYSGVWPDDLAQAESWTADKSTKPTKSSDDDAGLPYRYSLKMLMDVHLNRKIQQETGPKMVGHDSAEDARAAGDLVRLKIRNEWMDMQREGWKLVDGNFVAPGKASGLTEAFIEA
ncbi:uncharacterized protein FOBCDRAFT_239789 [Fusarium oxysporum Fo47]|uniref:uncharacterized protein n=1 Tax=Fusarium oxysporum Fo47 TaxID=660027 RepID=UPI002869E2DC|nr:uncharacterized protein FOBCDRAFT_239789 [Fusarium oxysporum Fo47]QKD54192.2 hypothetical protein FOBCDRAFT_239789 [Fusarium oxysporum Fo47]